MPIENITRSQKQGKLFGYKLSEELDRKNKLYQLRELINWSHLETKLSPTLISVNLVEQRCRFLKTAQNCLPKMLSCNEWPGMSGL